MYLVIFYLKFRNYEDQRKIDKSLETWKEHRWQRFIAVTIHTVQIIARLIKI